jgi:hypothetical protein
MRAFCATRNILNKKSNSFNQKVTSRFFASGKFTIDLPKWEGVDYDVKSIPTQTTTTSEELMDYFKQLTLMRRMEQLNFDLYRQKEIRGFCHLYIGQVYQILNLGSNCYWNGICNYQRRLRYYSI